jgi:hypothetical protein
MGEALLQELPMSRPKLIDLPLWFRLIFVASLAIFFVNFCYFLAPTTSLIMWTKSAMTARGSLSWLATLAASFAGASFAFLFARYQRTRDKLEGDIAAGNRALFTLTVMYNELKQHQMTVVEPYRDRADAWLNLNMSRPLKKDLSFEMKELSFLMPVKASIFQKLFLEEVRYRTNAFLVEEHRRLLISTAWPRLEEAGVLHRDNWPKADVEKVIGVSAVVQLKVITTAIIRDFDDGVKTSIDVFNKLRAALKAIYPKGKFIEFTP